jgi:hypothetical protein
MIATRTDLLTDWVVSRKGWQRRFRQTAQDEVV